MRHIVTLFLLFISLSSMAQTLYVYHFEGNVSISGGRTKAGTLKRGMAIEQGVTLNISQNASVHVLNEQGLAVLLDKPGKYTYEKVWAEVRKSTAVATPFFAHVWKKLREHHGHDPNDLGNAPKGGVSRAEWIVSLPDTAVVLAHKFALSWRPVSDQTFLALFGPDGKKVMKIALSDTVVTVYPYEMQLQRGEYYQWKLSKDLAGNQGVSGIIFLPTENWIASFRKEEQQLKAVLGSMHDPEFVRLQMDYFYTTRKILR